MGRKLMKAAVPAGQMEEGPQRRNVRQHGGTPASSLGGFGDLELLMGQGQGRTWISRGSCCLCIQFRLGVTANLGCPFYYSWN